MTQPAARDASAPGWVPLSVALLGIVLAFTSVSVLGYAAIALGVAAVIGGTTTARRADRAGHPVALPAQAAIMAGIGAAVLGWIATY